MGCPISSVLCEKWEPQKPAAKAVEVDVAVEVASRNKHSGPQPSKLCLKLTPHPKKPRGCPILARSVRKARPQLAEGAQAVGNQKKPSPGTPPRPFFVRPNPIEHS
jgi:hypothetical protein